MLMLVYRHVNAFLCFNTYTYRRVCYEDPMVYFTRANLSNERREKGIGSVLVGGSRGERVREREREREKEHWVQIIIQIISSQS